MIKAVIFDIDNTLYSYIKLTAFFHILGADGDYLIAVNDIAVFIDCKESVGVAVEGEARHKTEWRWTGRTLRKHP